MCRSHPSHFLSAVTRRRDGSCGWGLLGFTRGPVDVGCADRRARAGSRRGRDRAVPPTPAHNNLTLLHASHMRSQARNNAARTSHTCTAKQRSTDNKSRAQEHVGRPTERVSIHEHQARDGQRALRCRPAHHLASPPLSALDNTRTHRAPIPTSQETPHCSHRRRDEPLVSPRHAMTADRAFQHAPHPALDFRRISHNSRHPLWERASDRPLNDSPTLRCSASAVSLFHRNRTESTPLARIRRHAQNASPTRHPHARLLTHGRTHGRTTPTPAYKAGCGPEQRPLRTMLREQVPPRREWRCGIARAPTRTAAHTMACHGGMRARGRDPAPPKNPLSPRSRVQERSRYRFAPPGAPAAPATQLTSPLRAGRGARIRNGGAPVRGSNTHAHARRGGVVREGHVSRGRDGETVRVEKHGSSGSIVRQRDS